MSLLPKYRHIINPKLKHIYLSFDEQGELLIKSPKVSHKQIEQLLLKKSAWIRRTKEKIDQKRGKPVHFSGSDVLYFLGRPYPLRLQHHNKKYAKLLFDTEAFTLLYASFDTSCFHAKIDQFYKTEAQHYLPPLVEKWAKKMHLYPSEIHFRKTKRQWGSCSAKNALSLNTMMMKLPPDVIEYIVVHELAHIKHKHHQKAFWHLVAQHLPMYKQHIQTLKHYST